MTMNKFLVFLAKGMEAKGTDELSLTDILRITGEMPSEIHTVAERCRQRSYITARMSDDLAPEHGRHEYYFKLTVKGRAQI